MKAVPTFVLLFLLHSVISAQVEKLPDILTPDPVFEAQATRMGAKVFKLLPFGMFKDPPNSFEDKDNPIGIRGGGAFYSFTTGSHSYNKIPQIQADPMLNAGMLGGISFFADLGRRDLAFLDLSSEEVKFFLTYKPPQLLSEISQERLRIRGLKVGHTTIWPSLPATSGHTYLLRAIAWDEADVAVAIQILKIEFDGSVTIAWKGMGDFAKPVILFMSDEALQEIVDSFIAREKYLGEKVVVRNNWLYFVGPVHDHDLEIEKSLRQRGISFRGSGGELP